MEIELSKPKKLSELKEVKMEIVPASKSTPEPQPVANKEKSPSPAPSAKPPKSPEPVSTHTDDEVDAAPDSNDRKEQAIESDVSSGYCVFNLLSRTWNS